MLHDGKATFLLALVCVALAAPALAAGKKKKKHTDDDPDDPEERDETTDTQGGRDDDDDDRGPWKVTVPADLRGKGYSLRIGGETYPLDKGDITVRGGDNREEVQLLDRSGRILCDDEAYPDKYVFYPIRERTWKLGIWMGGTTVQGEAFRKLLQDSRLNEFEIEGLWQPGPLGVKLEIASLSSTQDHDSGKLTSTYDNSQTRLSAVYEVRPFRYSGGAVNKVHLLAGAGVFSSSHTIEISDGEVDLKDEYTTWGPLASLDLVYPLNGFWFGLKGYVSRQKIEFKEFDFSTTAVERGFLVGGDYAF